MEKKAASWAAFLSLSFPGTLVRRASRERVDCLVPARRRPLDRPNTVFAAAGVSLAFFVFEFTVSQQRPDRLRPGMG
jgi:hypothetical protein